MRVENTLMLCSLAGRSSMKCTATDTPSHGPGPAPLGDSPEAQAGGRGTEEGTGGESKEEKKDGQTTANQPCSGKTTGAIVHFSTSCTARPPKRIAVLRTNPRKESLGHSGLGPPSAGWERANSEKHRGDLKRRTPGRACVWYRDTACACTVPGPKSARLRMAQTRMLASGNLEDRQMERRSLNGDVASVHNRALW